ncbi:MAG: DsbE family thiol:disulfide interchange protein [Alphaproteobacteria bacterium]
MSAVSSRALAFAPLLALLAAGAIFSFAVMHGTPTRPSALIGREAPPLTLQKLDGVAVPELTAQDLLGHTTVVNFWASWCSPCRLEHQALMTLSLRKDLTLVGIAYKDDGAEARSFLEHLGNPFSRIGLDPQGRTAFDWGVSAVPETFVIGPEGRILAHEEGPLTDDAIKRLGLVPK